jgi:hypothetical protein
VSYENLKDMAPFDTHSQNFDDLAYAWTEGVRTALQGVAQFTSSDYDWYEHLFLNSFECGCDYGYEMEIDYCDYWKAHLKVEAAKKDLSDAQNELEEKWMEAKAAENVAGQARGAVFKAEESLAKKRKMLKPLSDEEEQLLP